MNTDIYENDYSARSGYRLGILTEDGVPSFLTDNYGDLLVFCSETQAEQYREKFDCEIILHIFNGTELLTAE